MRSILLLTCALFAGVKANPTDAGIRSLNEGDSLLAAVPTFSNHIIKCYLITPKNEIVEFKPNNNSNDKYELLDDSVISQCQARVNNVDENDNGIWALHSVDENGTYFSELYNLTVILSQAPEPEVESEPEFQPEVQIEYLPEQTIETVIGTSHYINIPDLNFVTNNNCKVILPSGQKYNLKKDTVAGIELHISTSTCGTMITVLSEDFVGNWTLVAEGTISNYDHIERRLPFVINVEAPEPDVEPESELQPEVEIEYLPEQTIDTVIGTSHYINIPDYNFVTSDNCKVILPSGQKYDLKKDTIAGIELHTSTSTCGTMITVLSEDFVGNWTLVAEGTRYSYDQIERRLPFVINVEDVKANITNAAIRSLHEGDSLLAAVPTFSNHIIKCYLVTPKSEIVEFKPNNNSNDKFELLDDSIISQCQARVNNVDENDNGIWALHSVDENGTYLSELYNLTVILPQAPEPEVQIEYLPEQTIDTVIGTSHYINIPDYNYVTSDNCKVILPSGQEYDLKKDTVAGIELHTSTSTCGTMITVLSKDFVGNWTLVAEGTTTSYDQIERRLPFIINVEAAEPDVEPESELQPEVQIEYLPEQTIETVIGTSHHINIPDLNFVTSDNCKVVLPSGQEYDLKKDTVAGIELDTSTSTCGTMVTVLSEDFVGNWTLVAEGTRYSYDQIERRLPFVINVEGVKSNVTVAAIRNLNEGDSLLTAVPTFSNHIIKCYLVTPKSEIVEFKPNNNSNEKYELLDDSIISQCQARVNNVDENDNGIWALHSVDENGTYLSELYNLTVILPKAPEPEVEPEPELKPEVQIEYLPDQTIDTVIGTSHHINIPDFNFVTSDNCKVVLPSGQKYDLKKDTVAGIELHTSTSTCGTMITVLSEDFVGNWTLVAEGTRYSSTQIERRLPFIINVEEIVEASPRSLTVAAGNSFIASLAAPTSHPETCRLITPHGEVYQSDLVMQKNTCTYTVNEVSAKDNGTWTIVYGNGITYRAPVEVLVIETNKSAVVSNLIWTLDRPVETTIGPEDAIYCKITDPNGYVVFENFGKCNVRLEKVQFQHGGRWTAAVGVHGHVLPQESEFFVDVVEAVSKEDVVTTVVQSEPWLAISCSVQSIHEVRACKFRDPSGRVLLAHEGVGQSRYTFQRNLANSQSNMNQTQVCGLNITDPEVQDIGLWRCALDTEGDVYYGHVRVLCPWILRDPEVAAAVVTEPTLTANRIKVTGLAGDSLSLSCSIQASIRYCYFRSRNGTIYNVAPGHTIGGVSYVGAGLDAGECGIRFPSMAVLDTGTWSCHVGLMNRTVVEQHANIAVNIEDQMTVVQNIRHDTLSIEATINQRRYVDYCIFVRIDGLGFTIDNAPERYHCLVYPSEGYCELRVTDPTVLDHHPWTVIAKIRGQDVEISRSTEMTLMIPVSTGPRPPISWMVFIIIGITLAVMSAALTITKNKRWISSRATQLRGSLRYSFTKRPNFSNTPTAA